MIRLDNGGGSGTETDPLSIHLDFDNLPASPIANGYAKNGNTLELWWNSVLRQSWTTTPVAPAAGSYMGFGLFTYS